MFLPSKPSATLCTELLVSRVESRRALCSEQARGRISFRVGIRPARLPRPLLSSSLEPRQSVLQANSVETRRKSRYLRVSCSRWLGRFRSVHADAGLSGSRRLSIEATPLRRHTTGVVWISGADICFLRPGPSRTLLTNAEVAPLGGRQRLASGTVGVCDGE